jgi:hypothetical protein
MVKLLKNLGTSIYFNGSQNSSKINNFKIIILWSRYDGMVKKPSHATFHLRPRWQKQSSMLNKQKEVKALATMKTFSESWCRFHFLWLYREDPDPKASVADPDPGFGAFLTPGSVIRAPGGVKISVSGSGMNHPDHISQTLETICWV